METVNVHKAKTHLSRLLDRAAKGEAITISKAGKPVAKLVPIEETPIDTSRRFGFMRGLKRSDFDVDALVFRRQLLDAGYEEMPVTSLHALELAGLPLIHRDPFDRLLIAQAMAEGVRLLTGDPQIAFYPGPILKV